MAEKKIKIIAENRKARHDFTIHETYEAGIELTGTEVKSLRAGKANMKDSYAQITKTAEVYVYNLHISPYDQGNRFNHEPLRNRRLLLHREEIRRLIGKVKGVPSKSSLSSCFPFRTFLRSMPFRLLDEAYV